MSFYLEVLPEVSNFIFSQPFIGQGFQCFMELHNLYDKNCYRVLYYSLSSSGLQTVSVLGCDWEGEVVVMECTQNGDWKSINQLDGVCANK